MIQSRGLARALDPRRAELVTGQTPVGHQQPHKGLDHIRTSVLQYTCRLTLHGARKTC